MPIVTFIPSGKKIEVSSGTLLFDAAKLAGLPVASSCNKEFTCGKCNMQVVSGEKHLTAQSDEEVQLLQREKKDVSDRISCVTKVQGDCSVTTSYW